MKPLLMIPGPTEIHPRVIQACVRPSIGHLDPDFVDMMDETCQMLRSIFQTQEEIIILVSSGRGGIEAALASSFEPGEQILIVTNGVFCKMIVSIAQRLGLKTVLVEFEPGKKIDLTKIREAIDEAGCIKGIATVHCETSTGMLNPVEEIGKIAKKYNLIYILDCVSSIGGVNVKTDEWAVDICITASHKAIGSMPGLSIISISDRMWKVFENRKCPIKSWYFDLNRWKLMWIPEERGGKTIFGYRRMPVSASTYLVYALHEACKIILEEGLSRRFARHQIIARQIRRAIMNMGMKIFPEQGVESSTLTAFCPPNQRKESEIREVMKNKFGVSIGGGLEEFHGKILRIGHMGNTASMEYVLPTITALECTLRELGEDIEIGKGVGMLM
jgi:alanine-glyoxylate transaminase/serine-glyoxylate transaminase/serine-pyruvate transaminase